jgi:hypothetical protein
MDFLYNEKLQISGWDQSLHCYIKKVDARISMSFSFLSGRFLASPIQLNSFDRVGGGRGMDTGVYKQTKNDICFKTKITLIKNQPS